MISVAASKPARALSRARSRGLSCARAALLALGALGALLVGGGAAHADPNPADKAAAQSLFDDGKKLLKEKKYADACPKLAESLRLDPALGTKLHLADCYEKNGQTASAWALFREAAEQAKIAGQGDREKKASERATALALRLCRLQIDVSTEAEVTGVEIKRDGTVLGSAGWSTSVPLDPGEHRIDAEAPGKKPWSVKVILKDGETTPVVVVVPALEDLPRPPPPPAPAIVEPPKIEPPKIDAPKVEPPAPPKVDASSETRPPPPKVDAPKPGPRAGTNVARGWVAPEPPPPSAARKVGYALTAIGGVGAAVGSGLGMAALVKNSDASANCKHSNACNTEGTNERALALRLANISTVTLAAGGGVFLAGVITLAVTQAPDPEEKLVLRVLPILGPGVAGISLGGLF